MANTLAVFYARQELQNSLLPQLVSHCKRERERGSSSFFNIVLVATICLAAVGFFVVFSTLDVLWVLLLQMFCGFQYFRSINQAVEIYIAPLKSLYSAVLPTQAKWKEAARDI